MSGELNTATEDSEQQAIVVATVAGMIITWNRAAEDLLGYPAEAAMGASLDLNVPVEHQAAHWAGFRRAMITPELRRLAADLPVRCADDQVRRFAASLTVSLMASVVPQAQWRCSVALARRVSVRSAKASSARRCSTSPFSQTVASCECRATTHRRNARSRLTFSKPILGSGAHKVLTLPLDSIVQVSARRVLGFRARPGWALQAPTLRSFATTLVPRR